MRRTESRGPERPKKLAWQVFRGADALRDGLLTVEQLRGKNWLRVAYGIYADSRLDRDHELRCRALALDLPAQTFFAGPSAACLYGVAHARTFDDPAHLIVPAGRRLNERKLTRVHRMTLTDHEVAMKGDLPVTTPLRTSWDIALWTDLIPAVTMIDALLAAQLLTADQLGELVQARFGWHGSQRAGRVFALADGASQSPQESRLRVMLIRSGLPRPVSQFPVQVNGRVLHPDLAWPEFKIAIEYDGRWHDAPGQFDLDRRRLNLLVAEGWIVLHVTARRLGSDFPALAEEARQALRSRGWRR